MAKINHSKSSYAEWCDTIYTTTGYNCTYLDEGQMDTIGKAFETASINWEKGLESDYFSDIESCQASYVGGAWEDLEKQARILDGECA